VAGTRWASRSNAPGSEAPAASAVATITRGS
jgi:hypothetical protein